jgi:argininosuccinate lyase
MQSVHGAIHAGVLDVLGVDNSVASRLSHGGTAPARVRDAAARWRERLG